MPYKKLIVPGEGHISLDQIVPISMEPDLPVCIRVAQTCLRTLVGRCTGSLSGKAIYLDLLPNGYEWELVEDDEGCLCLVVVKG